LEETELKEITVVESVFKADLKWLDFYKKLGHRRSVEWNK
jgi:hypothetical protein